MRLFLFCLLLGWFSCVRSDHVDCGLLPEPNDLCGYSEVCIVAGQHTDIGTVVVSHDEHYVYIEIILTGGWLLDEVHIALGNTLADIPQTNSGNPRIGHFPYGDEGLYLDRACYMISREELGWPLHDCNVTKIVAVHASVLTFEEQETAWACGTQFPGRSWATYIEYNLTCCEPPEPPPEDCDEQFRTQTQGGWGSTPQGNNPGQYLADNFATCFPTGIVIGCHACCTGGNEASFSSAGVVEDFLPEGGPATFFVQNYTDPLTTNAGVFAGQLLAATISTTFDSCIPDFGQSNLWLGDMVLNTGPCSGLTVQNVISIGNFMIAGCNEGSPTYAFTYSQISGCLATINENFVDGTQNNGNVCPPTATPTTTPTP